LKFLPLLLWGLLAVGIQRYGALLPSTVVDHPCLTPMYWSHSLKIDQWKYKEGFMQMQECPHTGTPQIVGCSFTLLKKTGQAEQ
jgi:hypothetical protein